MNVRQFFIQWKKNRKRIEVIDRFRKSINESYEKLSIKKELTSEQEHEIQAYFKEMIGMDVPTDWHRYFSARTGEFSVKYIPTAIYRLELIPRMNMFPFKNAYSDKNLQDILLPQAKQPEIFLKNMNGYFYIDNNPITIDEAVERCSNLGDFIIKPSLLSHGRGVAKYHVQDGSIFETGKGLKDLFAAYKKDFLLQKVVKQHKDMAALNPTSINTIRVLTYRSGNEILVVYTVIRIGRKGQIVDNETAGGMSAKINKDGTLAKYAYSVPGEDKIEFTDTGIRLLGYKIPSYDKTLAMVKDLHYHLPFFNLVGWDICIDEQGEPMMIEWNANSDPSQSANGPAFGEYTDRILKETMKCENSRPIESYEFYR